MPLTVITLKNVPPSLKGDLTKWMQEIATGVYIGNFNTKIRQNLWKRVVETAGCGEATLSFSCQNEIGYMFETSNTKRTVVDYEGIPLILIPEIQEEKEFEHDKKTTGYSDAARFRKVKKFSSVKAKKDCVNKNLNYIVLDIETDGLDEHSDTIIEIGAVKIYNGDIETFHRLISYNKELPKEIVKLTGIDSELLKKQGVGLKDALQDLMDFLGDSLVVGYNVEFDIRFLNKYTQDLFGKTINNEYLDLIRFIKKESQFQKNYKLETSLKSYGIDKEVPHRALEDARLTFELSLKVNKFLEKFK